MLKMLYIKGVRNPVTGVKKELNFLGKEEASGSNPDIGSTDNQQVTKRLSNSKITLANYERTFACISLFLFLSIQSVKTASFSVTQTKPKKRVGFPIR